MLLYKNTHKIARSLTLFTIFSTASYFYYKTHLPPKQKTYHISIVAAHNEKIKELVVPFLKSAFKKKFNANLEVEWVKHGGQNTNVKLINAKFKKNKGTTCGYDIIWGGGTIIFDKLEKQQRLAPLLLDQQTKENVPETLSNTKIRTQNWIATSLSSFGMIYNKAILKKLKRKPPTKWQDLADPNLFQQIVNVDPCQSSNIWTIYAMILESYGWEKGWELLVKIAANSIVFLDKSSSATSSIIQGVGLIAPSNDFYAKSTIYIHGEKNLDFVIPLGETIINADPIAILKGAPNEEKVIKFCIASILSPSFQQLLMLKKNTPNGPRTATIGRIGINKKAYEKVNKSHIASAINPFEVKKKDFIQLDVQKAGQQYPVVSAIFKAYCITAHEKLKKSWQVIIQNGCKQEDVKLLAHPPFTEAELQTLAAQWHNPLHRQKLIIQWNNRAMKRYQSIIAKYPNT